MAYNFGQGLSNRIHLRSDCDLDSIPLHAARNRYGHLHSLSDRDLGHTAWFRAICRGNEKPVASCSAVLDGCAHRYCDGAFPGMAERGRAEEALRESEARINLAANAANLGLWVWNLRDEELWVTEKWRKLFGFAESDPVNVGQLAQRVHPEDRERMKQRVQHMLEHGGVDRESEYRIMQPDGSTRWIAGYGGVELDEHGKPAFARGVSRDITERKIAEQELRETQQRMELAASAAKLGMWMWDIVRDELWITDKGRTLFGFDTVREARLRSLPTCVAS